ncbi:disintegrin and metalloproteinase domain-containing protein 9-like isoform X2 [Lytechinus variegatus]|uniref:disintegrin and metalloproteinase domain-containing protein 9-like isoform X2 n=1 Tax=Lytechinus variegatus TaxID=7654 RepID=UPI001BB2A6BE|nr:disintegrin and metalloproteinase domain-containing protein 9-like isoform X2 [Lytechinus variegatus]
MEGGHVVTKLPHKHHHCYYHGEVRDGNSSSVAISTCNGLSGLVHVDGEALAVAPLEGSPRQHVVYHQKDVISRGEKLVMDAKYESVGELPDISSKERHRRDILSETKYVELAIINDDAEYRFRGSIGAVQDRSKELANAMDMLYRALNIRIALVNVEVWTSKQIDLTADATSNLFKFQAWRSEHYSPRIHNDNAQLLTGIPFNDNVVGMAEHGKMCTEDKSCGVNTDIEEELSRQVVVVSHEMGHNLGFNHNTRSCTCPDASCIMDDILGYPPSTQFSSCTFETMRKVLQKGYGFCLLDYPKEFFGGPVCGNKFLEAGEDCDCGTPEECDTNCCVAETCRFHVNATCAEGECCDSNCQMLPAGTLCRDEYNPCDLPEYCTGTSATCPGNVYRQNGEKCDRRDSDSLCYDGQCHSYQQQCEEVWGKRTSVKAGVDECYALNEQGSHFGSCGETDQRPCPSSTDPDGPCYKPCEPENAKCGRLMCENVPDRPVLTSIATIAPGRAYDSKGREHICKTASLNFGTDVPDPGYVADGTSCAEGKICLNFQCQNISAVGIRPCPYNCHGNGMCNSKSHCHCYQGWAPPLCNTPGYGGSIDSGPAGPPDNVVVVTRTVTKVVTRYLPVSGPTLFGVSTGTVAALLVLFIVIFPLLTVCGVVIYCKRQRIRQMLNKSRETRTGHQSFRNSPGSNGAARKTVVTRTPSIRASPPTIEHIPNSSTGNVVHDVYPLIPTGPNVSYKPDRPPARPSSPPPKQTSKPPPLPSIASTPSTEAPTKPTAPPSRPQLPKLKPTVRSQSFNYPAKSESGPGARPGGPPGRPKPPAPPFKLAPPPKSPPPVPDSQTPAMSISGARAALKPVARPRPNVNSNNSKDCDWSQGGNLITKDSQEGEPFIAKKPTLAKKPSISRKPPLRPGRPPLRTQSMREPPTS